MPESEEQEPMIQEGEANEGEEQQPELEPQAEVKPSRRSRRRDAGESKEPTKSQAVAFIVSMFFGIIGLDRLYLGSIGLGLLKLLATIFAVVLLFVDTTSISPSFTPPVACAISALLLVVAVIMQIHDFLLIGLGRMRDSRGALLAGVPEAKPAACHQGRAFTLAIFTGYAGGDRFYLKSSLYGSIKMAIFVIGIILLLFGNPHWRPLREYPIIYKFEAVEVRDNTPGSSNVLLGLKDHRLTLCAYPTAKEIEEYEKANNDYFAKMAKAVKTFMPPPVGFNEKPTPFGAPSASGEEAAQPAAGEGDKPIAEGTLTTVTIAFDGVNHDAAVNQEMAKLRERMAIGLLQDKQKAIGHISVQFGQWPLTVENPRLALIGAAILGIAFLLWLIDILLIGCGKMKDGKGNPLGLDPAYGLLHCLNCHEQMTVDLEQKGLEGVVCRYEDCGNQAGVPEMEVVSEVIESREVSLRHSVAAISFAVGAAVCLIGSFLFLWPDTTWEISQAIGVDTAGEVLLGGFIVFLGLALWQAIAAEGRKVICEF